MIHARYHRPGARLRALAALAALCAAGVVHAAPAPQATAPAAAPAQAGAPAEYDTLVALFDEFRAWRAAPADAPIPDYAAGTIERRLAELAAFQQRLGAISPQAWDRHRQVDYLAVRAQLDQQEFVLRVSRPWARDPGLYVDPLLNVAFTSLPLKGEALAAFRTKLRNVPKTLAAAKTNLTEVVGAYADFALHNLTASDGVNLRHPYRAVPPDGVLGWFDDLLGRAKQEQPALVGDVERARASVADFERWLRENRSRMDRPSGVGKPLLDWYLRNVKLMPYTSDDVLLLGQRELERVYAFYTLERHRNRGLPELTLPKTREEYHARMAKMDAEVREFLVKDDFISVPDYIPKDWQQMGFNAVWLERAGGPNFWEQVLYRDPNPDHWHAVIPGHRFDGQVARTLTHPIRKHISDPGRTEGWALYVEEAPLQLGFYEKYDRPRARELIYVFGIFRAVRTIADVQMQSGRMNAKEAAEYWKKWTPWLDDNVARVDAEIYLRRPPGYGLSYTMGSFQMYKLLGERRLQLGEKFDLQEFHDWIMQTGRLPVSLLRYDLTGYDDEVRELWQRPSLQSVLAGGKN
jgi:hypothetical protein